MARRPDDVARCAAAARWSPSPGPRALEAAEICAARSGLSSSPATGSCAPAPRPRCARSPRDRDRGRRDLHGQGPRSTSTTRSRSARSASTRDYALAGFADADVVIAVGYDLVEHAPEHWNPRRDKKIVVLDSEPAEIDAFFVPEVELVGDIGHVLTRLAEECRDVPGPRRLAGCATSSSAACEAARDDDRSRCSRRARCGSSATRSAARTS